MWLYLLFNTKKQIEYSLSYDFSPFSFWGSEMSPISSPSIPKVPSLISGNDSPISTALLASEKAREWQMYSVLTNFLTFRGGSALMIEFEKKTASLFFNFSKLLFSRTSRILNDSNSKKPEIKWKITTIRPLDVVLQQWLYYLRQT